MYDAVGEPGHNGEEGVGMGGEDIAEVCAVENVFEGGENADPYWHAPVARYEAVKYQVSICWRFLLICTGRMSRRSRTGDEGEVGSPAGVEPDKPCYYR